MIRSLFIGTALGLSLFLGGLSMEAQEENVPEVVRTRLEEAQRQQRAGRLDEAVARAEEALEFGPQVVEVYLTLGALHHARGDLEASLRVFEQGLAQDAEHRGLLYNAAVLALRMEEPGHALEYADRALKRQRRDAQLLAIKSSALARLGRTEEAFAALEQAWKQDRKNAQLLFRLGNLHHQLGRSDEAIEAYRRALREDPKMERAHYNLGAVLFEMENFEEALAAYKIALAPLEKAHSAGEQVDVVHARAFANLGAIHLRQNANAKALTAYDTALALDANIKGVQASRGYLLFQLERFDEALVVYEAALKEGGVPPLTYLHLGRIHHRRGELEKTVARLEQGLGQYETEDQPSVWKLLALSQQSLGHEAQAEAAWREFLQRTPEDVAGLFSLGRLLRRGGRGVEARPLLEHALRLAPGHLGATLELASLAQAEGRRTEERQLYETALADSKVGAGLWAIRLRLALLLLRGGEVVEARHHLDTLAKITAEPTAKTATGNGGGPGEEEQRLISTLRGLLLVQEGDRMGARRALAEAAVQQPTSAAAQAEALLAAETGDATQALQRFAQTLGGKPTALERANLGQLLWSLGRFAEAQPHLEAAAAALPSWPSLRASLGDLALREGQYAEARAAFTEASELCRETGPGVSSAEEGVFTTFLYGDRRETLCQWVEQSLGRALVGAAYGEMPAALRRGGGALRVLREQVDRALDRELPSNLQAVALFVRGTTRLAVGDATGARRDLAAALGADLSPSLRPLAENNLGIALARSGQGEAARARWMAARSAKPTLAEASLNLGILLDEQGGAGEEALAYYEEYLGGAGGPRRSEVESWAERLRRIFR